MKSFNEQYQEFAELQRKSVAPLQQFSHVAVSAFERIVRKNYDVIGDVVEFTVSQAKVPADGATPQAYAEQQAAGMREFAEKVRTRASEYMSLAGDISEDMRKSVDTDELLDNARSVAHSSIESVSDAMSEAVEQSTTAVSQAADDMREAEASLARATRLATADVEKAADKAVSKASEAAGKTAATAKSTARAATGAGSRKAAASGKASSDTGTGSKPAARKRTSTSRQKKSA